MTKNRMETFSDGVIAIIITIMVLELKVPHGADLSALAPLTPVLLSYVLSFVFLGIYWSNHHHLLHAVEHVDGHILWANLHLLFWLSLTPFVTAWMGENHFARGPVALYGTVMLFAAIAYFILVRTLLTRHGPNSVLATALGRDFKDSHDRYANIEINYLLRRLETYYGLAILATNSEEAIKTLSDRVHLVVDFPRRPCS